MGRFQKWLENAQEPIKLDTNRPIKAVLDQYLAAFGRRLDSGISDEEVNKIIETNFNTIKFRYGINAANYFKENALFKLKNFKDFSQKLN